MLNSNLQNHLFVLLNAGGGGTRLWPRSRNATPKQFLKLFGKKTLTQITVERFAKLIPWEKIIIVTTSDDYKKEILNELPDLPSANIIVEPGRKNTAPAHGLGALFIIKRDTDAVILTSPTDHLVAPDEKYLEAMLIAAEVAYRGDILVTVGIKPKYPHTGYGYIKRGGRFSEDSGNRVFKVAKFTEKPDLNTAKKFIESGDYYWNTSQFVWRADSILKGLKNHAKDVSFLLDKIAKSIGTDKQDKTITEAYKEMPEIAIDYAVAERAKNFVVVPANYHWSDIGDWNEVWENLDKDKSGNVIIDGDEPGGRVISIDTTNSIVHSDGRLIVIIDVDDVAVVDTKNAVLVCSKSKAQNVKKIVEQLKKEKKIEYL
jgi:mannose-1-phosphate guanylyltransferase